jgi:hypothetical protein
MLRVVFIWLDARFLTSTTGDADQAEQGTAAGIAKLGHIVVPREQQTPEALATFQKSEIAK